MKSVFYLLLLCAPAPWLVCLDLPPTVKDAIQLELDGRGAEALERYRAALSTEPALVQDEAVELPLTVKVLAKAAHLSIDLGYGEEAWDLGGRLLAGKSREAVEAGTLVRMRLLRLEGKAKEALSLFQAFTRAWPQPSPAGGLATEVDRLRQDLGSQGGPATNPGPPASGPAAWVHSGDWERIDGPSEVLGIRVQQSVRVQIGVFRNWNNALTLVDMLREKGWSPFTEVRTNSSGDKLHVVYVVSRQPAADRARLQADGLLN